MFQRTPQWGIPHPNYMREVTPGTRLLMRDVPYYLGLVSLRDSCGRSATGSTSRSYGTPSGRTRSARSALQRQHARVPDRLHPRLSSATDRHCSTGACPTYPPYGKRPLLDNGWFRTVARDDVELITTDIAEVKPDGS